MTVHYANSCSIYCCMHMPPSCVCTSSDSVYPSTAAMANLMTYHDAVISERCSGFTIIIIICKLHTLNPYIPIYSLYCAIFNSDMYILIIL